MRQIIFLLALLICFSLQNEISQDTQKLLEIPLKRKEISLTEVEEGSRIEGSRFLATKLRNQEQVSPKSPTSNTIEKELLNYYNVQYSGTLYIGSEQTEMRLIFDTGSSWLWVPSIECTDCHESAKLFDYGKSQSFNQIGRQPQLIQYGGGSVWGYRAKDQVCLEKGNQDSCLPEHNFLSVYITNDLSGLQADGILGLAPSTQNSQADMFVNRLFREGIIGRRMFSLSLGGTDESSKIIFGGYNMKYAKENQQIVWNKLVNENYWTVSLNNAKLGDYTFMLDTNTAIVDSGTSYILMPENDFNEFRKVVEKGRRCSFDTGKTNLFYCTCMTETYSDFPDFEIKIGDNLFKVPSTSYMNRQNFKCYFRVLSQHFSTGQEYWILGDVFMLNYYTIFDLDKQQIGFIGSIHVDKISYWYDIIFACSILLAIFGLASFAISYYKDKKVCVVVKESELSDVGSYNPVKMNNAFANKEENSNPKYTNA